MQWISEAKCEVHEIIVCCGRTCSAQIPDIKPAEHLQDELKCQAHSRPDINA